MKPGPRGRAGLLPAMAALAMVAALGTDGTPRSGAVTTSARAPAVPTDIARSTEAVEALAAAAPSRPVADANPTHPRPANRGTGARWVGRPSYLMGAAAWSRHGSHPATPRWPGRNPETTFRRPLDRGSAPRGRGRRGP